MHGLGENETTVYTSPQPSLAREAKSISSSIIKLGSVLSNVNGYPFGKRKLKKLKVGCV